MAYSKTTWVNGSAPPINATNLNHAETGIGDAHDLIAALTARVEALEGSYPGPTALPVYGPGIAMNSLGNMVVGGTYTSKVSQRFTAQESSTLTDIRVLFVGYAYPGYGAGNGGTIRVTVRACDVAGLPDGTALATYDWTDSYSGDPGFQTITFSSPPTLTAGVMYHICYENVAGSPTTNYTSVDFSFCNNPTPPTPRQPRYPLDDWGAFRAMSGGAWALEASYTPLLQLHYGNGAYQGCAYYEMEIGNEVRVSGTQYMARERFTPTTTRQVSTVWVRLARNSGSGTGALTIRLEDSGGTLIDTATIADTSVFPVQDNTSAFVGGYWASASFSTPQTLTASTTYNLRFSTVAGTDLWQHGYESGSYSFNAATHFSDGYAQVSTNGGSTWNYVTGLDVDGDLQFYMT